jgi:hypothetical protein
MATYDVIAYGPNGTLNKGDVITGADVTSVYMQNGIVKYTQPDVGPTGHLDRWDGAAYTRATGTDGDYSYFVTNSGNSVLCDRITVVECTTDGIELAYQWDTWQLGATTIAYRDWVGSGSRNFPDSSATPKYITTTKLTKTVVMRRGREGVFLGWHSDPRVGPFALQIPAQNNNTDWGEREFGTGSGNRVSFSSSGNSALHPDWGADVRWGGAGVYPTIRHWWAGIDDANYASYANVDYIALQETGFPAEQTTGPWWIADLPSDNATTRPFCRYIVMRQRLECAAFQFSAGAYGQTVIHFVNEANDASGVPYRTMVFLGAFLYTSSDLALEPTTSLPSAVANRAHATDFDMSGQAELDVETTTIAEVRDRMIAALSASTPPTFRNRKFVHHREDVEFIDFCERMPTAAFRRFIIRDTFPGTSTINTIDLREIHTVIECVVAYPRQGGFRDSGAPRPILDLTDVVRGDFQLLRETIGVLGYAALERDGINAAVTGEEWSVEQGAACVYSLLRLPVMYREVPL